MLKFLNPIYIFWHLFKHKNLIWQLAKREITGRYKGSFIGIGWAFIQPIIMLSIYTFVFSVIFKAKWSSTLNNLDESKISFAMTLFMGIITFNIFGETINLAPSVILNNINYVKKVVFPLEILPFVKLLTVLTNSCFSLIILILGLLLTNLKINLTIFLLPIVWTPNIIFSLGCAYFLASLGVFIRDIEAFIGLLTTMLFFVSPVFYPIASIPKDFRIFCQLNPLALFIESSRQVVLFNQEPDWVLFGISFAVSLIILIFGFIFFMKSKKAFPDVI